MAFHSTIDSDAEGEYGFGDEDLSFCVGIGKNLEIAGMVLDDTPHVALAAAAPAWATASGMSEKISIAKGSAGIVGVLAGKSDVARAIRHTKVENLDFLPGGRRAPNPAELLGSEKMKKLVQRIKLQYDIVLFDCPPAIVVTDACVLASILDGTLIVVRAEQTAKESLLRSKALLEAVNSRVTGVVLNYVKTKELPYYRYYRYHRYYYTEGEKEGRKKSKV